MSRITLIFSLLLIANGCVGYIGGGFTSLTALIPAFWGIALGIAGLLALKEEWRMHAMHVAALLGLVGAGAAGAMAIKKIASGEASVLKLSILMQLTMAVICAVFVVFCVNSFIQARRNKKADS